MQLTHASAAHVYHCTLNPFHLCRCGVSGLLPPLQGAMLEEVEFDQDFDEMLSDYNLQPNKIERGDDDGGQIAFAGAIEKVAVQAQILERIYGPRLSMSGSCA